MEQEYRIFRRVEEDEVLMRRMPGYITAVCSAIQDWS